MVEESIMRQLPVAVQAALFKMADYEQSMFVEEYKRRKKSIGFACFWITLGGVLIWWLVSLFMIPKMVKDYNRDIAVDVMRSQKILTN